MLVHSRTEQFPSQRRGPELHNREIRMCLSIRQYRSFHRRTTLSSTWEICETRTLSRCVQFALRMNFALIAFRVMVSALYLMWIYVNV